MGLFLLLAGFLYTRAYPVYGVEVQGLYQGAVTVQSRGDERERQRAFTETFRQVLVKITGNTDIVEQPVIRRALSVADDYVDTWSYQAIGQDTGAGSIELVVNFFEPDVRSLLDAAGIPLWPGNRPFTLVWVVVQDELGERQLLGASSNNYRDILEIVTRETKQRGLPLLLPILDLDDLRAISAEDAWGMNTEKLLQASRRYQSESVLAIRLFRTVGGDVIGKSTYLLRDQVLELETFEATAETFIRDSIDLASRELSGYYAILLSGTNSNIEVNLTVAGIATAEDYAGLLAYVAGLTDVNSYQIASVNGDTIRLKLSTGGQLRQLVENIALNRTLLPTGDLSRNDDQIFMSYQWNK